MNTQEIFLVQIRSNMQPETPWAGMFTYPPQYSDLMVAVRRDIEIVQRPFRTLLNLVDRILHQSLPFHLGNPSPGNAISYTLDGGTMTITSARAYNDNPDTCVD